MDHVPGDGEGDGDSDGSPSRWRRLPDEIFDTVVPRVPDEAGLQDGPISSIAERLNLRKGSPSYRLRADPSIIRGQQRALYSPHSYLTYVVCVDDPAWQWNGRRVWYLAEAFTSAKYRNQGLMSAMASAILRKARAARVSVVVAKPAPRMQQYLNARKIPHGPMGNGWDEADWWVEVCPPHLPQ